MRHQLVMAVQAVPQAVGHRQPAPTTVLAEASAAAWSGVGIGLLLLLGSGVAAVLLIKRGRITSAPANSAPTSGPGAPTDTARGVPWRGVAASGSAIHDSPTNGDVHPAGGAIAASPLAGNRGRVWLIAAAVVVLLLVGVRVVAAASGGSDNHTATPSTTEPVAPFPAPSDSAGPDDAASPSVVPSGSASPSKARTTPSPRKTTAGPPKTTAPPPPPPGPPVTLWESSAHHANATFTPATDVLQACDKYEDGYSSLAVYTRTDVAGEKLLWASGGNGTCASTPLKLLPGAKITFKVCTADKPTNKRIACGASRTVNG